MKKLLILAVIVLFGTITLCAQGELDKQQKVFFRNERSFGILLNSDGIGVSYREAKRIDYRNKTLIEFDAGTLKNSKEYKLSLIHISEPTRRTPISYAVFCLKKKNY